MLSDEQSDQICKWAMEKRQIAVAVRSKTEFYGNLEDFSKPEDVALIAVGSTDVKIVNPRADECFDMLIFIEMKNCIEDLGHFDEVHYPALDSLGKELIHLVPPEKLNIFYTDEWCIAPVCNLKQTLCLPGPYLDDLAHIRNKDALKEICLKNQIPTAKFTTLNFEELTPKDVPEILEEVKDTLHDFPVFKRPVAMAGSAGAEPIRSAEELCNWSKDMINEGDTNSYLLETHLTGREFLASGIMLHDRTYVPLVVKYMEYGWSNVRYLRTGRPIPVFVDAFHHLHEEFPKIEEFVRKVKDAFDPPKSQFFCVQGFQLTPKNSDYALVEMALRPAGPRTNSVCYKSCGISQETALLMANIDSNYRPQVDPKWKQPPELALWFPQRRGLLKTHTLPPREQVQSTIKENWLAPLGSVFEKPTNVQEMMLILTLHNENRQQLLADAKWIADNWRPHLEKYPKNTRDNG